MREVQASVWEQIKAILVTKAEPEPPSFYEQMWPYVIKGGLYVLYALALFFGVFPFIFLAVMEVRGIVLTVWSRFTCSASSSPAKRSIPEAQRIPATNSTPASSASHNAPFSPKGIATTFSVNVVSQPTRESTTSTSSSSPTTSTSQRSFSGSRITPVPFSMESSPNMAILPTGTSVQLVSSPTPNNPETPQRTSSMGMSTSTLPASSSTISFRTRTTSGEGSPAPAVRLEDFLTSSPASSS